MKKIKMSYLSGKVYDTLDIKEEKTRYQHFFKESPSDQDVVDFLNYKDSYYKYELVDKKDE